MTLKIASLPLLLLTLLILVGCNSLEKLGQVGEIPQLTQIRNPQSNESYSKVTMPMPKQAANESAENSLWRAGARSFFKDQRAQDIGDILTIQIVVSDGADFKNESSRSRKTTEHIDMPNLLGYESKLPNIFPKAVDPKNLVNFSSNPTYDGVGEIKRSESLNLKIAATVTQVLPNGNLVIIGRQEMRVNGEVREMQITGVVRPQDILAENTISYEKIAEARISYGGRGQISDIQQPPWGQQILDVISPF
jgi:flagellar L-ring protein precursor FlgH